MKNNGSLQIQKGIAQALDNRRFRLILMPTEQCNFRCTYCYETFALGKMSADVVQGVKHLLTQRVSELQRLEIDWFGGEPLLAPDIIKEITQHAIALQARHSFKLQSSMTTNAFLLKSALLHELVTLGVKRYQITLDGFGEVHDRTRIQRNQQGSFDQIWHNLLSARDSNLDFKIMLRVHFHPGNIQQLFTLIDEIKHEFGNDARFNVFFKAIGHYGGPNDAATPIFTWEQKQKKQQQLLDRLGEAVEGTTLKLDEIYVCYASQPNSLVIRSDGNLAKCTVAFQDSRNQVGKIYPDGHLTFHTERLQLWFQGLENQDRRTLACPHSQLGSPIAPPMKSSSELPISSSQPVQVGGRSRK